jgi:hypothetical protein
VTDASPGPPGVRSGRAARVLLTGWFSFLHGEATAGDVLALDAVRQALGEAGIGYDVAWSPVFQPGALRLEDAEPARYRQLVFVCGPLYGEQIAGLHARFATLRRIAVDVTVIDPDAAAVTGFDLVLARDGDHSAPRRDLSAAAPAPAPVPVAGVALATGQGEYAGRRHHETVNGGLTSWLGGKTCAPVPLETRLDIRDWRLCSTAAAFEALVRRMDVVVTTRLHGLALALRAGVPALAVDPVHGSGKVTAQASAWRWPAILPADQAADPRRLDQWWHWCLSAEGRHAAATATATRTGPGQPGAMLASLVAELTGP